MTFFEQLEKHLSVKQHVLAQDEDGRYCIFSHLTDSDGYWRMSRWLSNEKVATDTIGNYIGLNREDIDRVSKEKKWKIIKAFDIPTGRFQIGDEVILSVDVKELYEKTGFDFINEIDELVGKKGIIKNYYGSDYAVSFFPDKFNFHIPHSALSYPIESEEESCSPGAFYKGKIFEIFGIDREKDGRIQITTEEDLGFMPHEKITLNDRVYTIKDVRHNSPNFFMYSHFIVIEAYPEEENTAAQEAIELLEKNGYVISKK